MNTEWVPTKEFAKVQRVKPSTVITAHCRTGGYFGIKPKKMRNGRLLWPVTNEDRRFANAN